MLRFTAARIGQSIITLIVLSVVVFFGSELTGDLALSLATADTTQAELEEIRQKLGLDRPAYIRYARYMINLAQGDLGVSGTSRRQVSEMMAERIPPTLQLAAVGLFIAMLIGIPLGVVAAVKRNTIFDQLSKLFAIIGMSAPQFWVAIMLIMFFGAQLKWLPTYGRGGIDHYILPGIAISLFVMAGFMRLTRSSMLEVLDSEFVKFARIKGLQERLVIFKHALKNAIIPVLTFGGVSFAGLLNGAIVVEVVFAWPGLGRLMLDAIRERDTVVIMATILTSGFIYIFLSTVVDILYAYVDPRIRYQ
ncbi:MAG: ABC transporter permease [Chloroflexi bacterium]|nr:ABC transporter permease [Chloroflexota bacterium]MYD47136.1 ABC transporter permease [Chloroflexota bacterium]